MGLINCFFSYAHDDDITNNGRVKILFDDIRKEYKAVTGEAAESSFLDSEGIKQGDNWSEVISKNINDLPILIPIITPSYFNSPFCRDELRSYLNRIEKGDNVVILPIYYINVPDFSESDPRFELLNAIKKIQYSDLRGIRFKQTDSEEYKTKVNDIVTRLIDLNQHLEELSLKITQDCQNNIVETTQEESGLLDQLEHIEDSIQECTDFQSTINEIMTLISNTVEEGSRRLETANNSNSPMSAKLSIIRKIALEITEPVDQLYVISKEFSVSMESFDKKVVAMLEIISMSPDINAKKAMCKFEDDLKVLVRNLGNSDESIKSMRVSFNYISKMSKDFRPILRKQDAAITTIQESYIAFERWLSLIKAYGLSCE